MGIHISFLFIEKSYALHLYLLSICFIFYPLKVTLTFYYMFKSIDAL